MAQTIAPLRVFQKTSLSQTERTAVCWQTIKVRSNIWNLWEGDKNTPRVECLSRTITHTLNAKRPGFVPQRVPTTRAVLQKSSVRFLLLVFCHCAFCLCVCVCVWCAVVEGAEVGRRAKSNTTSLWSYQLGTTPHSPPLCAEFSQISKSSLFWFSCRWMKLSCLPFGNWYTSKKVLPPSHDPRKKQWKLLSRVVHAGLGAIRGSRCKNKNEKHFWPQNKRKQIPRWFSGPS